MSDHSSAEIFGTMFAKLARNPTDEHKALAAELFKFSQNFDFSEEQMGVDRELKILGLARKGTDPRFQQDGKVWIYGPENPAKRKAK